MQPVQYSDYEIAEFQKEFADRRKRQITFTWLMIPLALLFAFDYVGMIHIGVLGEISLLILLVLLIPAYRNWSCPACKRMFGRYGGLNPSHCRFCGIPLRPEGEIAGPIH